MVSIPSNNDFGDKKKKPVAKSKVEKNKEKAKAEKDAQAPSPRFTDTTLGASYERWWRARLKKFKGSAVIGWVLAVAIEAIVLLLLASLLMGRSTKIEMNIGESRGRLRKTMNGADTHPWLPAGILDKEMINGVPWEYGIGETSSIGPLHHHEIDETIRGPSITTLRDRAESMCRGCLRPQSPELPPVFPEEVYVGNEEYPRRA